MKKFFFGNKNSTICTVGVALCLFMAIGVPLSDLAAFKAAGASGIGWSVYWLISVPFLTFALVKEHRARIVPRRTDIGPAW